MAASDHLQPQQFQVRDIPTADLLSKHWDTTSVGTPAQMRQYDSGYLNNVLRPQIQESGRIDPLEMRHGVLDDGHHRALVGSDLGVKSMTVHDYGSQAQPVAPSRTNPYRPPAGDGPPQSPGMPGIEDALRGIRF